VHCKLRCVLCCFVLCEESRALNSLFDLKRELRQLIEPDDNFLTGLLSEGVLSHEQFIRVCSYQTPYERNDELLSYLLDDYLTDHYVKVKKVLTETNQDHVINFISLRGSTFAYRLAVDL
jgi:hypothetical protein